MQHALAVERSCAVTAVALSGQRREGVRLVSGAQARLRPELRASTSSTCRTRRRRGLDAADPDMRCRAAMFAVEGAHRRIPAQRAVGPRAECADTRRGGCRAGLDRGELARAAARNAPAAARPRRRRPATWTPRDAQSRSRSWRGRTQPLIVDPLLGRLPMAYTDPQGLADKLRRTFGRMPWTTTQKRLPRPYSVPVGGDGGVRNPNLPPPSRPQDNDLDVTPEHRPGIPYPEWNAWTKSFMPDHVAVLERAHTSRHAPSGADVRRSAEVVLRAHPSRDEEPSGGRLRSRRRAVRQPLHRPDDRRGDRTAHLPRSAAQQPRRHHGVAARRQLVAGRARRQDLQARIGLCRRAFAGDDAGPRAPRHLRVHRQHPAPRRGDVPQGLRRPPVRAPWRPRPRHRRIHQARRPSPPYDEPAARPTVGATAAHRDR